MGRLRIKAVKWKCKAVDPGLKEQFINGINEHTMTTEIIVLKDTVLK